MGSNVSKEVPSNGGESICSSTDDGHTNNTNDKTHHDHPEESNNDDDNEQQRNLPPEVWAGIYECKQAVVIISSIFLRILHHTIMYTICSFVYYLLIYSHSRFASHTSLIYQYEYL